MRLSNDTFVDIPVELVWREGKAYAHCPKHNFYVRGIAFAPQNECVDCWAAYWFTVDATTPTWDKGAAREMLMMGLEHLSEELEAGTWDVKLHDRPVIEIENDVPDDLLAEEMAKDPS